MAKILVISPTPTHPQDAGNRARIFSLLSGLKAAGHMICLAFVKMENGDEESMSKAWDGFFRIAYKRSRIRWLKRKMFWGAFRLGYDKFLPYQIDDWYEPEISRRLIEIQKRIKPDVIIIEYVFLSKAFECFGGEVLKILDTHDIFGDRHRLYLEHDITPQWFYTTKAEERKALDRADLILAIQREDAAYLSQLTHRKVITAGHMNQVPNNQKRIEGEADSLLFVGSDNPINVDALKWFLDEIFPRVRLKIPEIKLDVVGNCAQLVSPVDGLIQTGRVTDLAPHYQRAKVVINPVRFGTGLKIKTIEALAMGRPLVTTTVGATGLEEWDGKAFLSANTAEEFLEKILSVCLSEELRIELSRNALEFIQKNNSTALKPLTDAITEYVK
jgi:polysaccharide biosynthesis protein PslH